jgi:hypothetical protein
MNDLANQGSLDCIDLDMDFKNLLHGHCLPV